MPENQSIADQSTNSAPEEKKETPLFRRVSLQLNLGTTHLGDVEQISAAIKNALESLKISSSPSVKHYYEAEIIITGSKY